MEMPYQMSYLHWGVEGGLESPWILLLPWKKKDSPFPHKTCCLPFLLTLINDIWIHPMPRPNTCVSFLTQPPLYLIHFQVPSAQPLASLLLPCYKHLTFKQITVPKGFFMAGTYSFSLITINYTKVKVISLNFNSQALKVFLGISMPIRMDSLFRRLSVRPS